ncbi:MAG TPA: motility protein A [Anaerohalosphaeraceae bacterium]|nr:motility protein A [Phycisphaerae bacterium]HOK94932.1 motility protein A [Anaerohalosphaeraceae bacterium]HOL30762.1 motility protein A [Anaerohalosphaeraceae bacterium]HOM75423.1 motility protein A [Anaerohalosphaeraceae bacterium]HPC63017.1 motility protein A [Anaerohalosphaeraceae bacterium]
MDIATIIGVLLGLVFILGAIAVGAGAKMFFNVPSLIITIGGMLCATLIHFSLSQFLSIFSIIKKTIVSKLPAQADIIQKMVNYAAINRRDGALALEPEIHKLDDHFFAKGLQMLVDGQNEETIRDYLTLEIEYLQERHSVGKKILEFMGASAPAFGMIGTLIGLIQMLSNLSDPSGLGVGMATALVTTFYGAFASNLIFIPLAGKLGIYSKTETLLKEMITEGLCAIAQGENPTLVRERMQAFMSHSSRKDIKAVI